VVASRVYRGALRCYPASFRRRYGDDLVAAFEDLCADRGLRVASWRTMVDLVVTVPKYRLESVMSEHRAHLTLAALTVTLAFAGFATLAVGAWPVSLVLLAVGVVSLISQRSALAQSLRHRDQNRRRRRRHPLFGALVAIAVFAGVVVAFVVDIGDERVGNGALIVYNVAGLLSLLGAVVLTVVGLRTHDRSPAATPV
jgi:MFS family permease